MHTSSGFNQPQCFHRHGEWSGHVRARLLGFLFPCVSDQWLTALRIGLGTQVALYCWSLRTDWQHLFAENNQGWIRRDLLESVLSTQAPFVPRLGWLITIGRDLGVNEGAVLSAIWIVLFVAGVALFLGICCRAVAITAWFLHLCAVKSGLIMTYGVDNFTTIGLFYLMLAPFPDFYALDHKVMRAPLKDRHLHGLFRRVLQLHLCVIYFFAGLTKCLGPGWWNGESMWRSLTRAPFNVLPAEFLLSSQWMLPLAGIMVCILETGYPFFIWWRRTRLVWLISVLLMHVGIGIALGLYLFALIMIVLNLAAFGPGILWPERIVPESVEAETPPAPSLAT